jgi:iron complex outermembrane recepter protein
MKTYIESPEQAAVNWKEIKGYEDYGKGQLGLSVNILPNSRNKISLAAFGSFRNAEELRPFNLLQENSGYYGLRGYYQIARKKNSLKLTFTAGTELFREKYNWSTWSNHLPDEILSDNKELRAYENLFVQLETNFREKLFLSAGINGNLTRFKYTDHYLPDGNQSGNRSFHPVLSPRLGANYRISEVFTCFGNISHGFSIPSFEETLLPEGAINPDIEPESGWNMEAGLRAGLNNKIWATLSYYRIYIKNLLVARRTGEDAWVGVNAGRSIHPGLEAEMKWVVFHPRSYPSLVLTGNITRTNFRFEHFVDNDNDYSGNLNPGTSRTTWLLAGNFQPAKPVTIRAWHRYTGKMPVNDSNSDFTDPYGLTNLEVSYSATTGNFYFTLKTGIQNLFNVRHAAMLAINAPAFGEAPPRYYYPGNPINYFLTLQIGWDGSSLPDNQNRFTD